MNQCPEVTALQAWEAVPLTPTVKLSPCALRCPTAPPFGSHVPARLVHQGAGGEAVRLDGMKHPIIPPSRCQQAAVPQRKAAHFEQSHHFMPPPSASRSLSCPRMARRCCPPTLQPQRSVCLCRQDCTMSRKQLFIVTGVLPNWQKGKVICSNVPSWYAQLVFQLSLFIQLSLKCKKVTPKIHQLFIRYNVQLLLISNAHQPITREQLPAPMRWKTFVVSKKKDLNVFEQQHC